jgi:hypothetical protein
MDMSVPCKCHSSISVGDELLARSGLKSIERHHRRGKRLSSASCEMWVVEAEAIRLSLARQSRK